MVADRLRRLLVGSRHIRAGFDDGFAPMPSLAPRLPLGAPSNEEARAAVFL
jgi:hypothetical protein